MNQFQINGSTTNIDFWDVFSNLLCRYVLFPECLIWEKYLEIAVSIRIQRPNFIELFMSVQF